LRFRNGKSPTTAKDCESFEEVIPEDINKMVENLNEYRKTLKEILKRKFKNE
jgi:precorrin-2 dehydrogenase/sirohydrochlorin ferrochelatase